MLRYRCKLIESVCVCYVRLVTRRRPTASQLSTFREDIINFEEEPSDRGTAFPYPPPDENSSRRVNAEETLRQPLRISPEGRIPLSERGEEIPLEVEFDTLIDRMYEFTRYILHFYVYCIVILFLLRLHFY